MFAIIKIIMILYFYEFLGGTINQLLFKKQKFNILFGFIYNIIAVQVITLYLIPIHSSLRLVEVMYIGVLIILIAYALSRDPQIIIDQFRIIGKIKRIQWLDIIMIGILTVMLYILVVAGNDQWLYGALVNSAFTQYGIQSQVGPVDYFLSDSIALHMLNSYYVYIAMIMDFFHIDYIPYVFGIYRCIEAVLVIQVIRVLCYLIQSEYNRTKILFFLGFIGLNITSNSLINSNDTVLLFSGDMGTIYFQIIAPTLLYIYVKEKKEIYLNLVIVFLFAITTTTIIIVPFMILLLDYIFQKKHKVAYVLYFIMLSPYLITLFHSRIILLLIICLLISIMTVLYLKINSKIILILMYSSLLIFFFDFDQINKMIFNPISSEYFIIIVIFLIIYFIDIEWITKEEYKWIILWGLLIVLLSSRYDTISPQTAVIRNRSFVFFPANLIIVYITVKYLSEKILLIVISIISLFMMKSYYNNMFTSQLYSISEYFEESKSYESHEDYIINDNNIIAILKAAKEDTQYDLYFETLESEDSTETATPLLNISAFNPNINLYDSKSIDKYCTIEDVECYHAYPKKLYEISYDDINKGNLLETDDYYIIKESDEI